MANNATKKEIIFPKLDLPKLKSKITKVLGSKSVCDKPRKAALKVIRDAYDDARLSMESKFFENPKLVRKVLKTYTKITCLLYTSPSPRDMRRSRMPSSA